MNLYQTLDKPLAYLAEVEQGFIKALRMEKPFVQQGLLPNLLPHMLGFFHFLRQQIDSF